jgi:hypothetical protein
LGNVGTTFATLPGCFGNLGGCRVTIAGAGTISSGVTDEIRVEINYRFGPGSVVARY